MIDYRKLLIKYIYHVCHEERTSFITFKSDWMNEEEWKELEKISNMNYEQMEKQFG